MASEILLDTPWITRSGLAASICSWRSVTALVGVELVIDDLMLEGRAVNTARFVDLVDGDFRTSRWAPEDPASGPVRDKLA